MEATKTQICIKCGRELPLSEFYKNSKSKNGHLSTCKQCVSEYSKLYYAKKKYGNIRQNTSQNPKYADKLPRELIEEMREIKNELIARGFGCEAYKITYVNEIII